MGKHWDTKDSGQPFPTSSKTLPRGVKRGSTVSACDQCHRFKVKCIREKDECRRCIANGSTCTYSFSVPAESHVRDDTAESHKVMKQHRNSHSGHQRSPEEGTAIFRFLVAPLTLCLGAGFNLDRDNLISSLEENENTGESCYPNHK